MHLFLSSLCHAIWTLPLLPLSLLPSFPLFNPFIPSDSSPYKKQERNLSLMHTLSLSAWIYLQHCSMIKKYFILGCIHIAHAWSVPDLMEIIRKSFSGERHSVQMQYTEVKCQKPWWKYECMPIKIWIRGDELRIRIFVQLQHLIYSYIHIYNIPVSSPCIQLVTFTPDSVVGLSVV